MYIFVVLIWDLLFSCFPRVTYGSSGPDSSPHQIYYSTRNSNCSRVNKRIEKEQEMESEKTVDGREEA